MKRFYSKKLKKLVYLGQKADNKFWDDQWKKEIKQEDKFNNIFNEHSFVSNHTKKYLPPGSKILEGGCGRGNHVFSLDKNGFKVIGLDSAKDTVSYLKKRFPNLDFRFGDITNLDLESSSLDGYWSLGVIEHFYDGYQDSLNEMKRVLKKDGYLFLSMPAMNPLRKIKAFFNLYPFFKEDEIAKNNFYQYCLDPTIVVRDFSSQGFSLVKKFYTAGFKGLKDESPDFLKYFLQKIYDSNHILAKIIKFSIEKITSRFFGHSCLYIFKKDGEFSKQKKIFTNEELDKRNEGLKELTELIELKEVNYFLSDGVLLGAVREKNFIKWDWDVEITILTESIWDKVDSFLEVVKKNGFEIGSIDSSYKNFKINLFKNENKYSLNGLIINGEKRVRNSYGYPKELFEKKEVIEFRGKSYPAPYRIEQYLEYQYGDWKTPITEKDRYIKNKYLSKAVRNDVSLKQKIIYKCFKAARKIKSKTFRFIKINLFLGPSRELNFEKMYLFSIKEKLNILEIGSNDGREIINLFNFKNRPKDLKIFLIEPSKKNILKVKRFFKRYLKNTNNIKIYQKAIGKKDEVEKFYYSEEKPNLNSNKANDFHNSFEEVEFVSIESFCKHQGVSSPIFIKMDVEGQEVDILSSSIDFFNSQSDVSILFEIHPNTYSKYNSLYSVLVRLFDVGFEPIMVESAGIPRPKKFKEFGYEPFEINNNRGLYKNISKNFILDITTKNIQEELERFNGVKKVLSLKQARSILIQKR